VREREKTKEREIKQERERETERERESDLSDRQRCEHHWGERERER